MRSNHLLRGDCLDHLRTLKSNSIDLLCTDPPYGYGFMGKDWDRAVPGTEVWKECLRALKPGAFAFVMSAPRSDVQWAMIDRLQRAGFRVDFTPLYWTYATGFPKAMNAAKAADAWVKTGKAGPSAVHATELTNPSATVAKRALPNNGVLGTKKLMLRGKGGRPQTRQAHRLQGAFCGYQPKPAVEVIIVAMKPLSEKSYTDQALKNGKGITWLDDARIPTIQEIANHSRSAGAAISKGKYGDSKAQETHQTEGQKTGRFPANLLVSDAVLEDHSRFFSLDEWARTLPFLAIQKASKREKNIGLHDFDFVRSSDRRKSDGIGGANPHNRTNKSKQNYHPTVKPLTLMSYLITLGSRPGDVVLDPFLGSGTTAMAAKSLGRRYIGIEREKEYLAIARARLATIATVTAA